MTSPTQPSDEAVVAKVSDEGRSNAAHWWKLATERQQEIERLTAELAQRDEAVARDAGRLDWIESQAVDGIHVECCYTTSRGLSLKQIATVYTGNPQREFKADTLRAAIDRAAEGRAK